MEDRRRRIEGSSGSCSGIRVVACKVPVASTVASFAPELQCVSRVGREDVIIVEEVQWMAVVSVVSQARSFRNRCRPRDVLVRTTCQLLEFDAIRGPSASSGTTFTVQVDQPSLRD